MITEHVQYWDSVAVEWQGERRDALWRAYCDAVHIELFSRWLPQTPIPRLLKTDLFDEAVSDGIIPFLSTRARTVIGMDLSSTTLREARSHSGGRRVTCTDVRRLPFADGSFDVVVSNSTLDHFAERREIVLSLRELYRVLRPGGQLLLTIDNLANPAIAVRNALPFHVLHHAGILPYYVGVTCGPRRLRRMLKEAELDIMDMTAIEHCPRLPAVLFARIMGGATSPSIRHVLVRLLMVFEQMADWPTRFLSGNFIAVRCRKHTSSAGRPQTAHERTK